MQVTARYPSKASPFSYYPQVPPASYAPMQNGFASPSIVQQPGVVRPGSGYVPTDYRVIQAPVQPVIPSAAVRPAPATRARAHTSGSVSTAPASAMATQLASSPPPPAPQTQSPVPALTPQGVTSTPLTQARIRFTDFYRSGDVLPTRPPAATPPNRMVYSTPMRIYDQPAYTPPTQASRQKPGSAPMQMRALSSPTEAPRMHVPSLSGSAPIADASSRTRSHPPAASPSDRMIYSAPMRVYDQPAYTPPTQASRQAPGSAPMQMRRGLESPAEAPMRVPRSRQPQTQTSPPESAPIPPRSANPPPALPVDVWDTPPTQASYQGAGSAPMQMRRLVPTAEAPVRAPRSRQPRTQTSPLESALIRMSSMANPLPRPPVDVWNSSPYRHILENLPSDRNFLELADVPETAPLPPSGLGLMFDRDEGKQPFRGPGDVGAESSRHGRSRSQTTMTTTTTSVVPPVRFNHAGQYAGFVNHSPHRVLYENKMFPTALHLLEALKFTHKPALQERIRKCKNVNDMYPLSASFQEYVRSDWGGVFLKAMEDVLYLKFKQHPSLRALLLGTGLADIIYSDENWYWGEGPLGDGNNELGKALVRVRERLQDDEN